MLNIYLIDILIMMLNIIASHNKLLYAIINTLYKITTTSMIKFAKARHLENKSFPEYRKFWVPNLWSELQFCLSAENFGRWIAILSHSAENFERWITILSHSVENFVGYPPCIPKFLNFAKFSDQGNFGRIFWLVVFYFVGTNILKHE